MREEAEVGVTARMTIVRTSDRGESGGRMMDVGASLVEKKLLIYEFLMKFLK